ncbi:tRNA (N6-threonylcarbamoyladenosine(37)-N6)-methyltransferase TrmO [Desulfofustis glycolicus]|uniref:tRNA-Thr(GGU) m(6)t(6)A37 methyltransferase TsaA n=1 Tax=Desulfofustis glycolicus DSM 9705 TaxID=1121409 RepID=A0A1M5WKX6_9BACT|nr:tRNA (N6-threonylcarbamoyladenosine(37)-N6)-methyltransferase TrmO [Desulfofustis glycolicus]MCB2217133.1 tRNA (N6-threonylcarbamoyladenosine(37)-N6)-methyltransferase TrmO [Desulfobulbaceae bacterium]SHH88189.1 tRNA-Thr(GGU) m(6)t(6)A37 methyltransferase TsaA [Desulfofustis glycolicus DSM 9705]
MDNDAGHEGPHHLLRTIGIIRSCYREKFGIPRQAGLTPSARAELELAGPYARAEMVRGLEQFSHLWLVFLFHDATSEGWQRTVRPPRLGGRRRLGVFATRSPHRPNHIGLSAVSLLGVECSGGGVRLKLGGVDLLDGTPVLDIKPYLPYSDLIEAATSGWTDTDSRAVPVIFTPAAASFGAAYRERTGRALLPLVEEVLRQDPRPASQRGRRTGFAMTLWDVNIRWQVTETCFLVDYCEWLEGREGLSSG